MHVESISASNGHKRVTFGLEPAADYHKPLAEFLINREHNLVLVSGVYEYPTHVLRDLRSLLSLKSINICFPSTLNSIFEG